MLSWALPAAWSLKISLSNRERLRHYRLQVSLSQGQALAHWAQAALRLAKLQLTLQLEEHRVPG